MTAAAGRPELPSWARARYGMSPDSIYDGEVIPDSSSPLHFIDYPPARLANAIAPTSSEHRRGGGGFDRTSAEVKWSTMGFHKFSVLL